MTSQKILLDPNYRNHNNDIPWELDMKRFRREVVRREGLAWELPGGWPGGCPGGCPILSTLPSRFQPLLLSSLLLDSFSELSAKTFFSWLLDEEGVVPGTFKSSRLIKPMIKKRNQLQNLNASKKWKNHIYNTRSNFTWFFQSCIFAKNKLL